MPGQSQNILELLGQANAGLPIAPGAGTAAGLTPNPGESRFNYGIRNAIGTLGQLLHAANPIAPITDYLNAPAAAPAPAANAPTASDWDLSGGTPTAGASPTLADLVGAITQVESGGKAGAVGPNTPYGNAQGSMQVLPSTAKATALAHGIPWQPELMAAVTPEGKDYQQKIGTLVLQDNLKATGGDVPSAIADYFAGPNPALHGPKTAAYVQSVLGNLQPAGPYPQLSTMDPNAAAAMLPNAPVLAPPDFSKAGPVPQMAQQTAPAPTLPQMSPEDIASRINDFDALRPKNFDEAKAHTQMVQDMWTGALKGAMAVGDTQGFGDLLLGIATGVQSAKSSDLKSQDAEREARQETQRAFDFQLKQLGYAMDDESTRRKTASDLATWTMDQNNAKTDYENANNKFQVAVKQIQGAFDTDKANATLGFEAATRQGEAKLAASEKGVDTSNQQAERDFASKLQVYGVDAATSRTLKGKESAYKDVLAEGGIADPDLPLKSKDPVGINFLKGAGAIVAQDKPQAIEALANELVLNGQLPVLEAAASPDLKAKLVSIDKVAKGPGGPTAAGKLLAQELSKNQAAVPGLVQQYAASAGFPMAKTMASRIKTKPATAAPTVP